MTLRPDGSSVGCPSTAKVVQDDHELPFYHKPQQLAFYAVIRAHRLAKSGRTSSGEGSEGLEGIRTSGFSRLHRRLYMTPPATSLFASYRFFLGGVVVLEQPEIGCANRPCNFRGRWLYASQITSPYFTFHITASLL